MAASAVDNGKLCINEILCFLTRKCNIIFFDKLVAICVNHFSWQEIVKAKYMLMSDEDGSLGQRLPRRKGPGKEKNTVSDLLKIVLDPGISLPTFVALYIERLPPVGMDDIDASNICLEMCSIREKMRGTENLVLDMSSIKEQLDELCAIKEQLK